MLQEPSSNDDGEMTLLTCMDISTEEFKTHLATLLPEGVYYTSKSSVHTIYCWQYCVTLPLVAMMFTTTEWCWQSSDLNWGALSNSLAVHIHNLLLTSLHHCVDCAYFARHLQISCDYALRLCWCPLSIVVQIAPRRLLCWFHCCGLQSHRSVPKSYSRYCLAVVLCAYYLWSLDRAVTVCVHSGNQESRGHKREASLQC